MSTMITPEDILKQRAMKRNSNMIAHSSNSTGNFFARPDCPCYTCRDALDPTGEEDARIQNENSMPREPPKLERQNAVCLDCNESHLCNDPCRPRRISLPPPTMTLRRHPFTPSLSPLTGIVSPRSLSDSSVSSSDRLRICYDMEQKIIGMLQKLKKNYKRLEVILGEEENFHSHDEMAANEFLLTETIDKIDAVEDFLKVLKNE